MDYVNFIEFLSFTATASTIGMFLCGIQICTRIHRRGSTEGTGVAPFFLTSVSCICWLGYGILKKDQTIIFVNGIGLVFQTVYLAYYYMKTRLKNRLRHLILIEFFIAILTTILIKHQSFSLNLKENILGIICMLLNIATIASPLADIGQIIRSKSTESLPFMLCLANMTVCLQWLLYGFLVDDLYMKVPNSIGTIIASVQLSLFVIYPRSYKVLVVRKSNV